MRAISICCPARSALVKACYWTLWLNFSRATTHCFVGCQCISSGNGLDSSLSCASVLQTRRCTAIKLWMPASIAFCTSIQRSSATLRQCARYSQPVCRADPQRRAQPWPACRGTDRRVRQPGAPKLCRDMADGMLNLYSVIKDSGAHIRFAMLAGCLNSAQAPCSPV